MSSESSAKEPTSPGELQPTKSQGQLSCTDEAWAVNEASQIIERIHEQALKLEHDVMPYLNQDPFGALKRDSEEGEDDAEESDDEEWTLLDEFRHICSEGSLEAIKEIVKCVKEKRLPEAFTSEHVKGEKYPYSLRDLANRSSDVQGTTPLHCACANGHLEVAKYLVQELQSMCTANHSGNTPLHWAAENGQVQIVKWLCATFKELDVLQKNLFGRSAVATAMESENDELMLAILNHPSAEPPADFMGQEGDPVIDQSEINQTDEQVQAHSRKKEKP